MPKPWEMMGFMSRVSIIIQLFPLLSDRQIKTVTDEWSKNDYVDNWEGEQEAIKDLMTALRHESMSDEQKEEEKQRIALLMEEYSWESKQ
jgi:hypothetical protein